MKTSFFDFQLPELLIAAHPASPRDAARMLVVSQAFLDKAIRDLPAFLKPGDVMVFNDTRVIPARLYGKRDEAKIEVLLHKAVIPAKAGIHAAYVCANGEMDSRLPGNDNFVWQCFAKPAKKLRPGDSLTFADDFHAEVMEKLPNGEVLLRFSGNVYEQLRQHGHMPLPPYIEKKRPADASDHAHYQTVYARHDGSVAAPTAGLHFTENLLAAIDALGVKRVHVTLHVGGGTFLPVKAEDTEDHIMHSEYAVVTPDAAQAINHAKAAGGRIIAVGTTSLRTLESAANERGLVQPFSGETSIFIAPGYRFKAVDMLLTNFHLPRSTLFMLVCAFCGTPRMHAAYAHAITQQYRFYSYGDACLLYKDDRMSG